MYCMYEMDSNFYAQYSNMIDQLAKIIRVSNSFKTVIRYFGKLWHKSNVYIIRFYWLITLYIFTLLPHNAIFLTLKNSCAREEVSDVFFFKQKFKRSLSKNIFLLSLHLRPLPLVRAPPQLILSPSLKTFCLYPLLATSPSTASPFARYTIYKALNARYISRIILAEEGVPIFDSHTRFNPLEITTFILERRYALVSINYPQKLTSYAVIYHSSPNCHLSLLCCGYFMFKFHWYLFYT